MPNKSLDAVLREAFAIESRQLMARLTAHVAQFDRGTGHPHELLRQMSVDLHTLTGASLTVGVEAVSILCQALEDFVREMLRGDRPLNRPTIEVLRQAVQQLGLACSDGSATHFASVLQRLRITSDWRSDEFRLDRMTDSTTPVTTTETTQQDSDNAPTDSDRCIRTVKRRFTLVHAMWHQLFKSLANGGQCTSDFTEFSSEFAAAMSLLNSLSEQIVPTNAASPSAGDEPDDGLPDELDDHEDVNKRILVVDDSRTARIWVRNILESAGYTVYMATDGQEALDIIPSLTHLDLLVTDLKMPRMDGATLCQKVRSRTELAYVPIVIVTSQDDDLVIANGLLCGANAYVVKRDLSEKRFLQTVECLLN